MVVTRLVTRSAFSQNNYTFILKTPAGWGCAKIAAAPIFCFPPVRVALGYDGESNQQCWDWIMAVSDKYGNDFLDEKMHGILEHYDESGYLGLGKKFRKIK